jgi:hypothetical protein
MSKRFGRNQRRRMREQVAGLEQAVQMDRALLQRQRGELHELSEEIRDAKAIVGAYSVVLEPDRLRVNGPPRDVVELPLPLLPNDEFVLADDDSAPPSYVEERVPLSVMLARVDEDQMKRAVHVRVEFAGGQWGYGMSQQAMAKLPARQLTKTIARELARVIAPEIRKRARPW